MQRGCSADARWSEQKVSVNTTRDTMTCFSSRALIACFVSLDSAALHGEATNLRTGGNTVHSKPRSMDYVAEQTLIFAAPGGPEAGAPLLRAP